MSDATVVRVHPRDPNHLDLLVEGWRVIATAAGDQAPVVDAVVRLRAGRRSVIGNGEGTTPSAALDSAANAAVRQALDDAEGPTDAYARVRSQCVMSPLASTRSATIEVTAAVTHREGLVNRIAALMNPYEVTSFEYERSADGTGSRTRVGIVGAPSDVDRAARKLRRVIGVVDVTINPAANLPG